MRVVVIFFLIALANASSQLHEQRKDKYELNPINDVETIDEAKQQKKRTLIGLTPYSYAAKHVGVHPLGFKYILGYGPIAYSPYARPVALFKPLLHSHGWKSVVPVHAVHSVPMKPVHVKPVVPIVPVPHFKPAVHHHPHLHVYRHPVQPHLHTIHPHVHPVQPVIPVQPEEPIHHHVHSVVPAQPVVPVQPVQPTVPEEKPIVPTHVVPNIAKPVLHPQSQLPQLPQIPFAYPFFKPLNIPSQIYPVQPSLVQQYVPRVHFQSPVVQPLVPQSLFPQPLGVQSLLPQNPLVHSFVPQVSIQPPVVHAVPQSPVVQHLLPQPPPVQHLLPQPSVVQHILPQPPPVQHLLPQPPVVQHLLPQPPPVQHLLPQPPPVQHLLPQLPPVQHLLPNPPPIQHLLPNPPPIQPVLPQPSPIQPFVPQSPGIQHLLPQLPPQPSILHIFKQFPFIKHATPLLPVNPPVQVPQAPVPPVTIHSPGTTDDRGVSVQIPLHLPEHPNFQPGVNIIPQFPAQPDSTDQDVRGQSPIDQPDFHNEQGGQVDNPFIIPQPQPRVPTHTAPQTPLYLPPHPLLRSGIANSINHGEQTNSVQTEFSATFPKHPFVEHGSQGIHHPSISLEPPYGPDHNLG